MTNVMEAIKMMTNAPWRKTGLNDMLRMKHERQTSLFEWSNSGIQARHPIGMARHPIGLIDRGGHYEKYDEQNTFLFERN